MTRDVQVFDRLIEAAVLIQDDLARSFAGGPLTVARTHLLWELRRLGPSTQQALAAALGVSPRNVTGLVDALEASDHVHRAAHPSDRRAVLVSLTRRGVRTITTMERERTELAAQLAGGVSEEDLEVVDRVLEMITTRLRTLMTPEAGS